MKRRQFRLGSILHVTFLDHCTLDGMEEPHEARLVTFEAFGRLVRQDARTWVLAPWVEPDGRGGFVLDENTKVIVVSRADVLKARRLG